MEKAINYYELKTELAEIGFHDPSVTDSLRQAIFMEKDEHHLVTHSQRVGFDLDLIRDGQGRLTFVGYSGSLGAGSANWQIQSFQPDVPVPLFQ